MAINWFPGHMATAIKEIGSLKADLIIEVVDARFVDGCRNNIWAHQFKDKFITIALKKDLATIEKRNDVLFVSLKDKQANRTILDYINSFMQAKIERLKQKGLHKPHFILLVVGLPNVGKSSLINCLARKNIVKVENRPAVTKNIRLIPINDTYSIYDTPGIFYRNVQQDVDGYKLSLIGCIKKEIVPIEEVVQWAFVYYQKKYQKEFYHMFDIAPQIDFDHFLLAVCERYGFVSANKFINAYNFIYKMLLDNKSFKINYHD